jgi:hypothetical protein
MPEGSTAPSTLTARDAALFVAIGALEGCIWLWVARGEGEPNVPSAVLAAAFGSSAAALVGRFTWSGAAFVRCVAVAGVLGAVVGLVTLAVLGHQPFEAAVGGDGVRLWYWALAGFAFLYVATPYAQCFQRRGAPRFPYPELFDHSWNNFFIGLVALLFVGVLWALLALWGALFKVVGISFFADLFTSRQFAFVVSFAAFGYGLSVGRSNAGVIATLRRIALMIARVLLPLIALVAVLFALVLPFTGLTPLWETGSTTPLLLTLLAALTLFLNAVFEDGERQAPYTALLRRGVGVAVLLMPVYAGIALHGSWLRVSQHGLTPDRVHALVFVAIASVYAFGYAASALQRGERWMQGIRRVNHVAALSIASVAILLQLPPLDPFRLSASQQEARLLRGEVAVERFDFDLLERRLGHYGREALERLAHLTEHPESAAIREAVANVHLRGQRVDAIEWALAPAGVEVPEELAGVVREYVSARGGRCTKSDCVLIGARLDGDDALEYCLLSNDRFGSICFGSSGGRGWQTIGKPQYQGTGGWPSAADLTSAIGDRPVPMRAPRYQEIVLPDGALQVVPE